MQTKVGRVHPSRPSSERKKMSTLKGRLSHLPALKVLALQHSISINYFEIVILIKLYGNRERFINGEPSPPGGDTGPG